MNYKVTIEYDGSNYNGFSSQPNKNTIYDVFNKVSTNIFKEEITLTGASRTDSGVHALGQCVLIKSSKEIPKNNLKKALNTMLPKDIRVSKIDLVNDDFHPRHDALNKTYVYTISKKETAFNYKYSYNVNYTLDINLMINASKFLIGKHDYSAFCASKTNVVDKVRTINYINIIEDNDYITITINGNGFLYNMVRIIVGTLIDVGSNKIKDSHVKTILASKDRSNASKTVTGSGLYLKEINYK